MKKELLSRGIFDAIASKRIVKTGYVGFPGGIYVHECDSVAAHSNAVTILATIIAYEFKDEIKKTAGVELNIGEIALMASFHDFGETKSGDTGAQSKGIYPTEYCKLHYLEREGLQTCMQDLKSEEFILILFDKYRKYISPESIIVHIADNLEGFEKAMSCAKGTPAIMNMALRIMKENLDVYGRKKDYDAALGKVCEIMVEKVLLPGLQNIIETYGYSYSVKDKILNFSEHTEAAENIRE